MIIQNDGRSYQVLRRLNGTGQTEELLCSGPDGGQCLLVCIRDAVLAKRFTLFLEERVVGREFADYRESFLSGGNLCVALSCPADAGVEEKLSGERCPLEERAEIFRRILERLLLLTPHPFFAANGLRPENVRVSGSLTVGFAYHLEGVERAESFTLAEVGRRLAGLADLLFKEELRREAYPALQEYVDRLEDGGSYLELYRSFSPVYEILLEKKETEAPPRSFGFRLWERTKRLLAAGKRVLMLLLLLAALLYMIRALRDDSGSRVVRRTFSQIGTLEIK